MPARSQKIIAFGDSLTATNSSKHLREGRVWIELLPNKFEGIRSLQFDPNTNYAESGATTAIMLNKANDVPAIHSTDIVISLIGSNDCLNLYFEFCKKLENKSIAPADLDKKIEEHVSFSIARLKEAAYILHGKGARNFWVVSLLDLSTAPLVAKAKPEAIQVAKKITATFNEQLLQLVNFFRKPENHTLDVAEMWFVDLHGAGLEASIKYEAAAISHFYDEVHPTSEAHEKIVNTMVANLGKFLK